MDLELYDNNGKLLDIDPTLDALPVVEVTAPYSGNYRLKVSVEHCASLLCSYRVRGFRY